MIETRQGNLSTSSQTLSPQVNFNMFHNEYYVNLKGFSGNHFYRIKYILNQGYLILLIHLISSDMIKEFVSKNFYNSLISIVTSEEKLVEENKMTGRVTVVTVVTVVKVQCNLAHHCLETRMELNKERRFLSQGQHPFLHHGAVDVIILDDDVFLQYFDCVEFVRPLPLCQHDLPEGALAKDHQVIEILSPDDVLPLHIVWDHWVLLDHLVLVIRMSLKKVS